MLWLRQTDLPLVARGEIDTLLRLLDAVQIEQAAPRADIDRAAFASAQIKLLMTLPGIDATVAHALMAAIGNIGRFACANKLAPLRVSQQGRRRSGPNKGQPLSDLHLTDFAQGLRRETRIPRHNTHAAHDKQHRQEIDRDIDN